MGKKKFDTLEEAQKEIERLLEVNASLEKKHNDEKQSAEEACMAEKKKLEDERDFYKINLQLLQSSFSADESQQQRLLFTNAKNSFKKYKDDPLRCLYYSYKPDVILNGFRLDLTKLTDLDAKKPVSYFLLFGKRPTGIFSKPGQPGTPNNPAHGNSNAFNETLTLLVLGLDDNNKFMVDTDPDTQQDKPIVYEYLSPCPNSCDGVESEIAKYF